MAEAQLVKVKTYVNLQPNEEMIWIGKPYFGENLTLKYVFIFAVNLLAIGFITYLIFYKDFLVFNTKKLGDYPVQIFTIAAFLYSFYSIYVGIAFLLNQNSMTYGFSNLRIFWARKDFSVIVNELPINKIAKIDLVGTDLNDKLFSIYFTPTETLKFEGYNYDDDDSRPFPSFEKVLHGDVVYMELMKTWKK